MSPAGFVVTLGSVLTRRALTGVAWNLVHGGTHDWRPTIPAAASAAHDHVLMSP